MKAPFDQVIVSSNENKLYLDLWPIVRDAWNHFGFQTHFISIKEETYGIPTCNYAKISRMIAASDLPGVSMISDVDMMPLQREYFDSFHIGGDALVSLTSDAYPDDPFRYPMCYLIATKDIWKQIVNPDGLSEGDLIESWCHDDWPIDQGKANPETLPFSDESLLANLLSNWTDGRILAHRRGWLEHPKIGKVAFGRIDRGAWEDTCALWQQREWIDAHLPIPIKMEHIARLVLNGRMAR